MADQPFVLGVNYWPRRKAMYWWSNFDAGEVRDEFAVIRALGLNLVRIFLLWDDFQPEPDSVSTACLKRLTTVCDAAADNGLQLDITFFTGHMSGPNWSPRWLLTGEPPLAHARQLVSGGQVVDSGYRNFFIDRAAWEAQRLQLRAVVGALRQHPGVGWWNLGNEPDLFAVAPDRETGRGWVRDMTAFIKELDDRHPVTCGLHIDSLFSAAPLRVDDAFAITDIAVMHAYPMYTDQARRPLDPDYVPFTCALTEALCGKPAFMEEFGGCIAPRGEDSQVWEWTAYGRPRRQFMASEEAMAEYLAEVLPQLVEVGATGAALWCFADYVPELYDRPPCDESRHERHFGLVRADGSLRPHAITLQRFAETRPMVRPAARRLALDITADDYYAAPDENFRRLYRQWTD